MRMIYVSWEFPPAVGGGIGTYVDAITRAMVRRGHEVTVVTVGNDAGPTREIRDGVHVIRLPLPCPAGPDALARLKGWIGHARLVSETLSKLVRGGIDLIEGPDFRGECADWLASTRAGERPITVLRLHTPTAVIRTFNPGQPRVAADEEFERGAILRADHVVSPSAALIEVVARYMNVDRPMRVSPHPVDERFLQSVAEPHESEEIVYVGRLEERKGVETLIRSAAAFLSALPGAKLVLIGADTEKSPGVSMRAELEARIASPIRDRIEWTGPLSRDALRERLARARLCVFPSHFENFPNTCLEAMALGKPVIGTHRTGMAEMIVDGESGLLVPPADASALSQAVIGLYNRSAEHRRRMGEIGRIRVRDEFSPEVVALRTERLYEVFRAADGRTQLRARVDPTADHSAAASGDIPVAVVVPCFNHGAFLPEALASVRAQTHPHLELIVVDDGSDDPRTIAALSEAERGGVAVLRQANAGLAAARNAGVRATRAPFFVPLDADDLIEPRFIERLLPILRSDASLGYAYSDAVLFGSESGTWNCPDYDPRRLLIESLSCATGLVRRAAFDAVGGYHPDMTRGFEDWDFWIALLAVGYRGRRIPEPLFRYRKHAGGSMLTRTEVHRREMTERMIAHHGELMRRLLGLKSAGSGNAIDETHAGLLAQAELDYITGSDFWRAASRIRRARMAGGLMNWLLGPSPEAIEGDPRRRLEAVKSSREYRLIQRLKRSPLYRWYARRRYGEQFDRRPAALR